MKRKATAVWKGSGKEGSGHLSTQSSDFKQDTIFFQFKIRRRARYKSRRTCRSSTCRVFYHEIEFCVGRSWIYTPGTYNGMHHYIRGWNSNAISIGFESQSAGISKEKFRCLCRRCKGKLPHFKIIEYECFIDGDFRIVSSFWFRVLKLHV